MRNWILLSFVIFLGFVTGCTKFHGIKALEPKPGHPVNAYQIDTLQPLLVWEASENPNATYDVVIYEEQVLPGGGVLKLKRQPGAKVYYRENLSESEHKVEEPLKPNTTYFWSVRVRKNGSVSSWSRYDYHGFYCIAWERQYNWLFNFKTPDQQK